MIKRVGNKTDRTVMMENAVHDYFKKTYGMELDNEVPVPGGVADLYGELYNNDGLEEVVIVEIKQSAADFFSGHGLNFVGTSNYIAVPSELVGFTIEFLRNYKFASSYIVGVLEVTDTAFVRTVTYPNYNRNNVFKPDTKCVCFETPYHLLQKCTGVYSSC